MVDKPVEYKRIKEMTELAVIQEEYSA